MNRKKFEYDVMGDGSRIKAPRGFVEEDLRTYAVVDDEGIEDGLNNAYANYQSRDLGLGNEDGTIGLYGNGTGDIQIDIVNSDENVEVSVYRLVRRWIKKK